MWCQFVLPQRKISILHLLDSESKYDDGDLFAVNFLAIEEARSSYCRL